MKIGIVGLGLIGGSIAKALKNGNKGYRVAAVDTQPDVLAEARRQGAADETSCTDYGVLTGCEAVFVAVPAEQTSAAVEKVYRAVGADALVTDVASVKGAVMRALPAGVRFVGGHPMAGVETGGFASSKAHLFENAYYALVAEGAADGDVRLMDSLVRDMGAIPIRVTAAQHDAAVSKISHLPHMIAYALVNTSLSGELTRKLAAGGFKDITRIASSSPDLWESISYFNKENILADIDAFIEQLTLLKRLLAEGHRKHFNAYLAAAREKRESLSDVTTGALSRAFELVIDIEDKPGMIGGVTAALAKAKISLSNIYVENSREGMPGVLRLRFFDKAATDRAREVLRKKELL